MARRFQRSTRVVAGPKRQTVWFEAAPVETAVGSASTAVLIGSLNAAALALRPFTVIRTRGLIHVRSNQIAATETYGCGYGHAVVSDQASAIGVTAVPTPITDYGSDLWYLIEQIQGRLDLATAVGFRDSGQAIYFDSKAMRRVDIGQDIVEVVESTAFQVGQQVTTSFRILVKLH